jgi:hypothetical protein
MKKHYFAFLLSALVLTLSASAQNVSTYKNVKLFVTADQPQGGKPATIEGTLNLDPSSKNVLFVVKESVKRTIPYRSISSLEFYMARHVLRVIYHDGNGAEQYIDMILPGGQQADLLKQIQAQTRIAIRLS